MTTDGLRHQPLPIALHGPRPLRPRLRHLGGLPFAHRAYLSGEGHGPSAMSGRIRSSPKSWSMRPTNRATGVRVIDRNTKQHLEFSGRAVVLGAVDDRVDPPALQLEVARSTRTVSRTRQACSATTSASTSWGRARAAPDHACGARNDQRRRTADRDVHRALPQPAGAASGLHPWLRISRAAPAAANIPGVAHSVPRIRRLVQAGRAAEVSDAALDHRLR